MAQIKRSVRTYSQRFESASGFLTNSYIDRMIPPLKNPAYEDFWESMEATWLDPIDDDCDSEDLTPLSGEDLWQALFGPEPVAQLRKQRRNSRNKRSRREGKGREDIVSVQNPAALLATWLGYEGTEPSPPQAALHSKKPVPGRRSTNRTPLVFESPLQAERGLQQHAHGGGQPLPHADGGMHQPPPPLTQGRPLPSLDAKEGAQSPPSLLHAPR